MAEVGLTYVLLHLNTAIMVQISKRKTVPTYNLKNNHEIISLSLQA